MEIENPDFNTDEALLDSDVELPDTQEEVFAPFGEVYYWNQAPPDDGPVAYTQDTEPYSPDYTDVEKEYMCDSDQYLAIERSRWSHDDFPNWDIKKSSNLICYKEFSIPMCDLVE